MNERQPQRINAATGDTGMGSEGGGTEPMTMSVASLRRSNAQTNPTRTLALSEAERSSRENTPVRVSAESLSRRPRSNPRSRTPMRYESPLDPDQFRRESLESEESSVPFANEGRRITIRPLAGTAVGTALVHRILEERPRSTARSRKQGPGCRKIRRWNNEKFTNLAAEIEASSARGALAAEAILRAQDEAHLYRAVYDPKDHRSATLSRFMQDDELKSVRDQFFEGELSGRPAEARSSRGTLNRPLTAQDMMHRVDDRLRRIVVKACTNSYPAAKVVNVFETFLIASFAGKKAKQLSSDWSSDLLLEPPTITRRKDLRHVAQFFFDAESSTGGFHRLLLHAVCQFHGLNAVSKMVDIEIDDKSRARALNVTGTITEDKYRLLSHATKEDATNHMVERLSTLAIR